jgi:hypothetical protein
MGGTQLEQNKKIFAVGPSTFVTIRNKNNNNISLNQSTEKISLTKVNFFLFIKNKIFEIFIRQLRTHLSVVEMTIVVHKLLILFLLQLIKKLLLVFLMINTKRLLIYHNQQQNHLLHSFIIVIQLQLSNVYMMRLFKQHHHQLHLDRLFG